MSRFWRLRSRPQRLVVKRLYRCSDDETEHFVAHPLALRQFCHVYPSPVPGDTTLLRQAPLIGAETPAPGNDRVVALASSLQVRRGGQAVGGQHGGRHELTDSRLIGDGVHRLSLLFGAPSGGLAGCAHVSLSVFSGKGGADGRVGTQ